MVDPIRATEKDWENVLSGARVGGYMARCILELRDRVAALEDAAAHPAPAAVSAVWVGTAADVAPQVVPVGTPVYMAPPPAPATADGLSPVEPAPQAQQGVMVEELACIMREMPDTGYKGEAAWLLKHRRLGPLLRGEGAFAPKRVLLPEEPNNGPALYELNRTRDRGCFLAGWKAARAEAFQQGGQAIHTPAPVRVVLPEEPPDKDPPVWMAPRDAYAWNCGRSSAWADLVIEMVRQQQGGQADG